MGATPSFERINYSVRPCKAAERHMLIDSIGRLANFAPLNRYQYVGFGSTFFIDFRLIHQRYGLTKLFSLEREIAKQKRFELNRPFQCVRVLYGEASATLLHPVIDWASQPSIVWLDYDRPLDLAKLGDCERVLRRLRHGSMFIVSFSSEAGKISDGDRYDVWKERLGQWLPSGENHYSLSAERIAEIGLDVLTEHAHQELEDAGSDKVFRQLFRFRYNDGHPMVTWGGLVLDRYRQREADGCTFDDLSFVVAEGGSTYGIELPNLTPIERAMVEKHLPNHLRLAKRALARHHVPAAEVDRLAAVYRYAPTFVESFA